MKKISDQLYMQLFMFVIYELPLVIIFYFLFSAFGFLSFLVFLCIGHLIIIAASMDRQLFEIKENFEESQRTLKNVEEQILQMRNDILKIPRA